MDVIKIRDLEIYGHHGVMKEENVLGQKFLVSLALYTDTRAAGESDNLADSLFCISVTMRRAAFSVTNVLIMQVTKIMTIVPLSISSLKSPMS